MITSITISTVLSTFIGSLAGIITRLLPEIIKLINKLIDNNHELKMLQKSKIITSNTIHSKSYNHSDVLALDKIINVQKPTGNKHIDRIRLLVRPITTYIILFLYVTIKLTWFYLNPTSSLILLWSSTDMGLLSGILSFWFLGRVFDRR